MLELVRGVLAGEDAYLVGGAVRDELLGRDVIDLDIVCADPKGAARAYAAVSGGSPFALSERHGAWRVTFPDGRSVDLAPLRGRIADDLALRDFTVNAIAKPLAGGEAIDPFAGRLDLEKRCLRAVSERIFDDDPLRLLRAVRLEEELGLTLDGGTEELARSHAALVNRPAGERILAELERLDWSGYERLEGLGLLSPLGGSLTLVHRVDRSLVDSPWLRLATVFGERLRGLPISGELERYLSKLLRAQAPEADSPRQIYRFRRACEPWALDALAYLGAGDFAGAVRGARLTEPDEPLLRGDELGVQPGPLVGELLALIAEERAAGTISTRSEALELVRRRLSS
jgi:hypothetical protein